MSIANFAVGVRGEASAYDDNLRARHRVASTLEEGYRFSVLWPAAGDGIIALAARPRCRA